MPKGTKAAPPQQSNLNEFWGKPKPKKKVESAPVASGSGTKKEGVDDMQVDEPPHRDTKGAHAAHIRSLSLNFAQPKSRVLLHTVRVMKHGHPL